MRITTTEPWKSQVQISTSETSPPKPSGITCEDHHVHPQKNQDQVPLEKSEG